VGLKQEDNIVVPLDCKHNHLSDIVVAAVVAVVVLLLKEIFINEASLE
jgi:hypothetical protein